MGAELAVGEEFAGHRIDRLLGRGGMGVVYLAEHIRLGRKVAIKVLSPDLARDDAFRRRFIRESRLAAALDHPNIVPVYDAGEVADVAYISMRLVDGPDLAAVLKTEGFLTPEASVAIAGQVASALDAAHAEGLVHRDVKPANILLQRERDGATGQRAFLSDFGITKHVAGVQTTEAGQFIGTIDYMAPEQITSGQLDGQTDQYSLACVLFQCFTGRVPFARSDQVAVMYGHLQEPAPRASDHRPGLGHGVDAAIQRGMAKRPDRRFPSCSEFVEAAAEGLGVRVHAPATRSRRSGRRASPTRRPLSPRRPAKSVGVPGGRPRRRTRAMLAAVLAIVLLGAAATGVALLSSRGTPSPPDGLERNRTSSPPGFQQDKQFPSSIRWQRAPDSNLDLGGPGRQVINRAAAGEGRVVAVGFEESPGGMDALVWVSPDGWNWDRRAPGSGAGPGDQVMDGVVYSGTGFVSVGTDSANGGRVKAAVWESSTGNDEWPRAEELGALATTDYEHVIHKVIRSGTGLIAVGWDSRTGDQDPALWRSDGKHWIKDSMDAEDGDQEVWAITPFGQSGFVAVGSSSANGDKDAAVWTSPDGYAWDRVPPETLQAPGHQIMKAVAPIAGGLVAVGRDRNKRSVKPAVWTSDDGVHWDPEANPATLRGPGYGEMTGVIPFRGGLIAVGDAGTRGDPDAAVWLSKDGSTWEPSESEDLTGPGTQEIKSILVFHRMLVAVGIDEASNDGDAAVWVGNPIYPGPTTGPSPTD
jgi:serine/threonine protein kinase